MTLDPHRIACELNTTYCNSLDRREPAALRALLHEDVTLVTEAGIRDGIDAVMASFDGFFSTQGRTNRHHVTNVRVVEATADRIESESYLLFLTERAGVVSMASGTYSDEIVRKADKWLFRRKKIELVIGPTRVNDSR